MKAIEKDYDIGDSLGSDYVLEHSSSGLKKMGFARACRYAAET
jgi:hypothetical protein